MNRIAVAALFAFTAILTAVGPAAAQDEYIPASGYFPEAVMDDYGNIHVTFGTWNGVWYVNYIRYDASAGDWGSPVLIPGSGDMVPVFGRPQVDVGPDGIAHVVWSPGGDPPIAWLMHAWAHNPQGTSWSYEALGPDWVAWPGVAVDDNNGVHFCHVRVIEGNPITWNVVYRYPGGEHTVYTAYDEVSKASYPFIVANGNTMYIVWEVGAGDRGNVSVASSDDWGDIRTIAWAPTALWFPGNPNPAIMAQGWPGVTFFATDWSGQEPLQVGVFYSQWDWQNYQQIAGGEAALIEDPGMEDWYPAIGYDHNGTRYLAWTYHDPAKDAIYYKAGEDPIVELPGAGDVTIAGGPGGAVLIRSVPSGGQMIARWLTTGPVYYPPTAVIDDIDPDTAYTYIDDVEFYGSAWDNDEGGASIVAYQWSSNLDGVLSQAEDFSMPASSLSIGTHTITFRAQDNEGDWGSDTATLVVISGDAPPASVTDLEASDTPGDQGGSISLTWTKSADDGAGADDVESYRVERRESQHGLQYDAIAQLPAGSEAYGDTTANDSLQYFYRVVTIDAIGQETPSAPVGPVTSGDDWVTPPSALTAADVPDDQGGAVQLAWTLSAEDGAGVDDVVEYRIMRAASGDTAYSVIATVSAGTQAYTDETVENLVLYSYVVRAVDDDGNLGDSSPASATPHDNVEPEPAPGLEGMCIGLEGWVFLSWDPSPDDTSGAEDVENYRVRRRSAQGASFQLIATIEPNEDGEYYYVDQTTASGARYYYLVRAFDGENVSDDSDIIEIYVTPADEGPNGAGIPDRLVLAEVTPNPVRDELRVTYGLPAAAEVEVTLRNVRGQTVAVIDNGARQAGYHTATRQLRAGTYPIEPGMLFVVFESQGSRLVRRVIVAE